MAQPPAGGRTGDEQAQSRFQLYVLAAIVVLGVVVRFQGLAAESLWEDEIAAVEIARHPLALLWSGWMVRETNPPLYYSILHFWMAAFGESEFAVRSLSALLGSAAIGLFYLLGRRIASWQVGLASALLAALWSHQVYFSQEARGYILGACGALVALIGLVRICDGLRQTTDASSPWPWLMYFGGSLVALYVHTTHVLLPFLANVYFAWLWLYRRPRPVRPMLVWIGVNAALVAAWAWWGWITYLQLQHTDVNISWIIKPSLYDALNIITVAYGPTGVTYDNTPLRFALQLGAAPLLMAAAAWGAFRLGLERAVLLAVFGVGAPLIIFLVSQSTPIMLPRVFLWVQFAVIIGLAAAMADPAVRRLALPIGLAVIVVLTLGRTVQDPKQPWRELLTELNRRAAPGELVFVTGAGVLVQHYCDQIHCRFHTIDIYQPNDAGRWTQGIFRGPRPTPSEVAPFLAGKAKVWSITHGTEDPTALLAPYAKPLPTPFDAKLPTTMKVTAWSPTR